MKRLMTTVAVLLAAAGAEVYAQYPEDALRFATPGFGVGARAVGMGGAYTGVSSDYSALYWNPAGLAQLIHNEFSIGLTYHKNSTASNLLGGEETASSNATELNTLGLVYPLPVRRGSAVIAFGFHRQSSFASGVSFSGFNPNSSIIQSWAPDGAFYPSDLSDNLAYQLYLTDIDTASGRFVSPIRNALAQTGKVLEGGGLNNWSAGGAVDVAKNFSLGITVTYLSGAYRYDRNYREADTRHNYETFPYDFSSLVVDDFIESDIAGWNAKVGMMYHIPERFRIGVTIKSPTSFNIRESFGTTARSTFDDGSLLPTDSPYSTKAMTEYDVRTPWVFGGGASVIIGDLVLSADVEYTDWTQLEFAKANADVLSQNADIKSIFQPTTNLRFGGEFEIPGVGLRLRGGYMVNPSPFKGDPREFDQRFLTGGLGIPVGESTMIDLAYARGWWETFIYNYNATSRVNERITTNNFMLTLTQRF